MRCTLEMTAYLARSSDACPNDKSPHRVLITFYASTAALLSYFRHFDRILSDPGTGLEAISPRGQAPHKGHFPSPTPFVAIV